MPVKKRQLSPKKKAKLTPKPRPKNRCMRNAKLTEYKFLHILRGFADEKTPKELAATAKVSEKTIRALYKLLRNHLIMAVIAHPYDFGKAGFYLLDGNQVGKRGVEFFRAVMESDDFKTYSKIHAPRSQDVKTKKDLIFEATVRVFCRISIDKNGLLSFSEKTTESIEIWKEMAEWLKQGQNDKNFQAENIEIYKRFNELSQRLKSLIQLEQLVLLKSQSKEHRYANGVLYNDLRRYLLKKPLS